MDNTLNIDPKIIQQLEEAFQGIKEVILMVVDDIKEVFNKIIGIDIEIKKVNHNTPYKLKIKYWILSNKPKFSYIRNRL